VKKKRNKIFYLDSFATATMNVSQITAGSIIARDFNSDKYVRFMRIAI